MKPATRLHRLPHLGKSPPTTIRRRPHLFRYDEGRSIPCARASGCSGFANAIVASMKIERSHFAAHLDVIYRMPMRHTADRAVGDKPGPLVDFLRPPIEGSDEQRKTFRGIAHTAKHHPCAHIV